MKLTFNNTPWILSPPHFLAGNFNDCVAAHYSKWYTCLQFAVLLLEFLVLVTVTVGELVNLQTHIIVATVAAAAAAAALYEPLACVGVHTHVIHACMYVFFSLNNCLNARSPLLN
jgi:hypothetical protein